MVTSGEAVGRVPRTSAVVVTFHPDADVAENVRWLAEQIADVVLVDNGSAPERLAPLYALAATGLCRVVEMGRNAGLGAALNAGLAAVRAAGGASTFLFDQDSRVSPGFAAAMTAALAAPDAARAGILIPHYIDRSTNEEIPPLRIAGGPVEAAMTSGALIRTAILDTVGSFDEDLFIDGTDYEFSLRVRAAGFTIDQVAGATLFHQPARRTRIRLAGRTLCTVSNYSAKRRYYIARNSVYLLRQAGQFPAFRRALWRAYVAEAAKILLFERNKTASAQMIWRGIRDARQGRMGYVIPL